MARKRLIENSQVEELDEDSVSNNVDTSPLEGMSKTNAISIVAKGMASSDNWEEIFQAVMDQIGHHADSIPDDAAEKNAASVAMKGAIKEDITNIFGDSKELSEEFKEKASTLFESAVGARVALIEAELQEQFEQVLQEELETINEQLIDQIDEYLSFVVENWLEENEIAIEKSVRAELAENFIENLGQLFIEHNFNVPDEQIEVVDMLADKVDSLEEAYNETLAENIELTKAVDQLLKNQLVNEIAEGLTAAETEKFKTLVEDFDLDDIEEYESKLITIKEHHFGKKINPKTRMINEESVYSEDEVRKELTENVKVAPMMQSFVEALDRTRRE